ncbi:hypothetical protein [Chryseobacterium herbae]|uniref:Lipoprotein n=1 Tax=Chryseobacterium herbae TaxID=2976476 RepID=A0ABT2ITX4_9FLAO|nr:hypothetical protein [Chryseobacterium sp. pc1-10]MCT2562278.1 hypothetical protein [Chryseobacterium sp. pc1-10]
MKCKILILIGGIFSLFSCNKKRMDFKFCYDSCLANESICFIMENNSDKKYIYYLPSSISDEGWGYYTGTKIIINDSDGQEPKVSGPIYLDKLFLNEKEMNEFILNEKKDSLLWINLLNKGMNIDYYWVKSYRAMQKNKFFVGPNEKNKFFKKIVFFKKQLKESGTYYTFDKNKKYFIQVEMEFDSTRIKEHLTPFDLDSLRKNHIKIFHGKLKTKKVPLILE